MIGLGCLQSILDDLAPFSKMCSNGIAAKLESNGCYGSESQAYTEGF
jgi:hypothetical protein